MPRRRLTGDSLTDEVWQDVIGHGGLAVGRSALPSNSDAGDGWELRQAGVVEGVGRVVRHLRRDLQNRQDVSVDALQSKPKHTKALFKITHMPRKDGWPVTQEATFCHTNHLRSGLRGAKSSFKVPTAESGAPLPGPGGCVKNQARASGCDRSARINV